MRIVMLTDDVEIDRRILLEAETLHGLGHEVILLAEGGPDRPDFERIGNLKVERVRYPEISPGELHLLRASGLISAALSRLSALIIRALGLIAQIISRGFSATIRLNQLAASYAVRGLRRLRRLPLHERAIVDRVVFYNPDVVHAHDLPRLRVGTKAKRRLKVPLVYDAHELYPEIGTLTPAQRDKLSRRERRYIRDADVVVTVNRYIAEEMAKRYGVKTPEVIRNATNWPATLPWDRCWDGFRERFAIPPGHRILLFQGWMSAQRGLQPLVRAMTRVPENIHLVFMGYGEARTELESITAAKGLGRRVHFMDAVPQNELLGWTRSADAGIIPYQPVDLNNYYCSPNKLFEFIQAELPIVANDLPFLRDVVAGEGFGIVHRLETVDDYAEAIRLMFEGDRINSFKEHLRRRKDEYSWSNEERKLVTIYEALGPIPSGGAPAGGPTGADVSASPGALS